MIVSSGRSEMPRPICGKLPGWGSTGCSTFRIGTAEFRPSVVGGARFPLIAALQNSPPTHCGHGARGYPTFRQSRASGFSEEQIGRFGFWRRANGRMARGFHFGSEMNIRRAKPIRSMEPLKSCSDFKASGGIRRRQRCTIRAPSSWRLSKIRMAAGEVPMAPCQRLRKQAWLSMHWLTKRRWSKLWNKAPNGSSRQSTHRRHWFLPPSVFTSPGCGTSSGCTRSSSPAEPWGGWIQSPRNSSLFSGVSKCFFSTSTCRVICIWRVEGLRRQSLRMFSRWQSRRIRCLSICRWVKTDSNRIRGYLARSGLSLLDMPLVAIELRRHPDSRQ